jgi:hypothetical protein
MGPDTAGRHFLDAMRSHNTKFYAQPGRFFKSCTRLKDLAQLSQGVFIGKQAFSLVFCHVKMSHCRIHLATITAMQVALKSCVARPLAQICAIFGTK